MEGSQLTHLFHIDVSPLLSPYPPLPFSKINLKKRDNMGREEKVDNIDGEWMRKVSIPCRTEL